MEILARICDYFECSIEDIVSYSPKKRKHENEDK
jgi:DNA-binding Xre family transcriptional regulator